MTTRDVLRWNLSALDLLHIMALAMRELLMRAIGRLMTLTPLNF